MSDLNKTVSDYFHRRVKGGEIGLEIECESDAFKDDSMGYKHWKVVEEGSLRNGREYVLISPILLKDLDNVLSEFEKNTERTKFKNSIRTSVHVHVNVLRETLLNVVNILTAYWLLEDALVSLNGPNREGNLFCLRAKDAEWLPMTVIDEIRRKQLFHSSSEDGYRYSAINLASLKRFGSLEFRFIRGTTDTREISVWVRALHHLCSASCRLSKPQDVLDIFESQSISYFLRFFLGGSAIVDHILLNNRSKESFTTNFGLMLDLNRVVKAELRRKIKVIEQDEDTI